MPPILIDEARRVGLDTAMLFLTLSLGQIIGLKDDGLEG
jgi:hypothetical protein